MRLTRCHVDLPLAEGATFALPEDVSRHLLQVLRLGSGDACVLFNGSGCDFDARIVTAGKRQAQVELTTCRRIDNESPLRITLLQGLARGEKMDWIVQKATELGVARILPATSERSEVRLDAQRAEKRQRHWREVAIAACEQSGRAILPEIAHTQPLAPAAAQCEGAKLILDPTADPSLHAAIAERPLACTLAIGPEGGWSDGDLDALRAAGFSGTRFGPRILRTETAGIAAIAALQALAGDLT